MRVRLPRSRKSDAASRTDERFVSQWSELQFPRLIGRRQKARRARLLLEAGFSLDQVARKLNLKLHHAPKKTERISLGTFLLLFGIVALFGTLLAFIPFFV